MPAKVSSSSIRSAKDDVVRVEFANGIEMQTEPSLPILDMLIGARAIDDG